MNQNRDFLTDRVRMRTDFSQTDQAKQIPPPPIEKTVRPCQNVISLPEWEGVEKDVPLSVLIEERKSVRKYTDQAITMKELSYLLWATQGVRRSMSSGTVLRTVPSAGNRHSFETYLYVQNVESLEVGLYRYLPLSHALVFEKAVENGQEKLAYAVLGQDFVATAPVVFLWTSVPYRTEWRYADASYKVICVDAGHVCQNLYLAATAIDCGICAIGAYLQDEVDKFLGLNTDNELTVYIAPLGKKP